MIIKILTIIEYNRYKHIKNRRMWNSIMFLIAGLGNPGREYANTRHNVGFDVLDLISSEYNISINRTKFKGEYGEGSISGEKVILLKPATFMNLSGESVAEAVKFYKIPKDKIIVVYDDISLEVGRMRIRKSGSAGGHNGIKNIIAQLGDDVFTRIKVGVGAPNGNLVNYVLGHFNEQDRTAVLKVFHASVNAAACIITEGADAAMNKYNGFKA